MTTSFFKTSLPAGVTATSGSTSAIPFLLSHTEVLDGGQTRIDLSFNTAMVARKGKIYVTDGALQTVIDRTTGELATRVVGATHTIELDVAGLHFSGTHVFLGALDLLPGHQYTILIEPGALASTAGPAFAGVRVPGPTNFTTPGGAVETLPPTLDPIALGADLGQHGNDFVTNGESQQLTGAIRGKLAPGQSFELLINGSPATYTLTEVSAGATYSYVWRFDGTLAEGLSTITARIVSGTSVIDEAQQTVRVDNTRPVVLTSPGDQTAFDAASPIVITFDEPVFWRESDDTTSQLVLKDWATGELTYIELTADHLTEGGTKLTIPASEHHLAPGKEYVIYLPSSVLDVAGNLISPYHIGFHTAPATPAPTLGAIVLPGDLGKFDNDFLTSGGGQKLTGGINGTFGPDQHFELLVDGEPAPAGSVTMGPAPEGSPHTFVWSYAPLKDGPTTVSARIINAGSVVAEVVQLVTVDPTAPTITTSPDGATALDPTGPVVITFSEEVYWVETAGAAGQLQIIGAEGTTYVTVTAAHMSDGGTTLTIPASDLHLAPGKDYQIVLPGTLQDLAGNLLGEHAIAFRTAATPAPISFDPIVLLNDLGQMHDFLTSGENQALEIAINRTLGAGESFELLINGTPANAADVTMTESSEGEAHANLWTFNGRLDDGLNTVTARIVSGGTVIAEVQQPITVDRTAPAVATAPSGNTAFDAPIVITFSEPVYLAHSEDPAQQLQIIDGDNIVTSIPLTATHLSEDGTKLTIAASEHHLVAGKDYRIALPGTLYDIAGNAIGTHAITFRAVSTTAPQALSASVANAAGSYNAGKQIEIRVEFSEAVRFVDGTDPHLALNNGGIASFYGLAGANTAVFHYSPAAGQDVALLNIASSSALVGSFENLAGNALQTSGLTFTGLTNIAPLPDSGIEIDTLAPSAPPVPVLDSASDSGLSDTDGITSDNTPTFTGTGEPNATIKLFSGETEIGETVVDPHGNWAITLAPLATDGIHWITARQTDRAGNESAASPQFKLTIDGSPAVLSSVTSAVPQGGVFVLKFSDLIYLAGSVGDVDVYRNGTIFDTIQPGDPEWIVETAGRYEYSVLKLSGLPDGRYTLDFELSSPVNLIGVASDNLLAANIVFDVGPTS